MYRRDGRLWRLRVPLFKIDGLTHPSVEWSIRCSSHIRGRHILEWRKAEEDGLTPLSEDIVCSIHGHLRGRAMGCDAFEGRLYQYIHHVWSRALFAKSILTDVHILTHTHTPTRRRIHTQTHKYAPTHSWTVHEAADTTRVRWIVLTSPSAWSCHWFQN